MDTDLQSNVFFFKMQIRGTVFNDLNQNGVRDFGETGVAGRVIQLVDPSGTVVAQTTTLDNGSYSFDNLSASFEPAVAYQVREVLPAGVSQTTANPPAMTFTRGQTYSRMDFGNFRSGFRLSTSTATSPTSGSSVVTDAGVTGWQWDGWIADVVRRLDRRL